MKKLLITAVAALAIGNSFAQSNIIPSTGNVGIGTTTPSEKLSVNGNVKIDSTLSVDSVIVKDLHVGHGMRIEGETKVEEMEINGPVIVNGKASFTDTAEFYGNAIFHGNTNFQGTNVIDGPSFFNNKIILPDLATYTDLNTFTVVGVTDDGTVKKVDFNLGALPGILYGPKTCSPDGQVASPTWSNGLNKIYVSCPEVKVGVGTSTPLYSMDVRGTGFFSTGIRIGTTTPSSQITMPAMIEMEAPVTARPFIRLSSKNGSSAPEVKFRVENDGQLYCTSVKVRLSADIPVPDYVFKPEYKLMPLGELKTFVAKNSHLPNIPSEAVIKAEGLNIEQMQLKLLEKVEELTLYVIDLNDSREELERKNEELLKEIEALKVAISKK